MKEAEMIAMRQATYTRFKNAVLDLEVLQDVPRLIIDGELTNFQEFVCPAPVTAFFRETKDPFCPHSDGYIYQRPFPSHCPNPPRYRDAAKEIAAIVASEEMQVYLHSARAGERVIPKNWRENFAVPSPVGKKVLSLCYAIPSVSAAMGYTLGIDIHQADDNTIKIDSYVEKPSVGHADGQDYITGQIFLKLLHGSIFDVRRFELTQLKQLTK